MNEDFSHIIKVLRNLINNENLSSQNVEQIKDLVQAMNNIIYQVAELKFQTLKKFEEDSLEQFRVETENVIETWELYQNLAVGNEIQKQFAKTYVFFKFVDPKIIYDKVVFRLESLPDNEKDDFAILLPQLSFLQGEINYKIKNYSLIEQYVDMMCDHVEDYKWLYEHLGDWRSKALLNGIIEYWFTFDRKKLWKMSEGAFPDYFDMDLFNCTEEEVFVDCGAYTGDSAIGFVNMCEGYKKIYCYEMTPATCRLLEENVLGWRLENVIIRNKGVANQNKTIYIDDGVDAGNSISKVGDCLVELITLDEDIAEPITCIKMDVEGAEKDALYGAERHIINEKPKLLISAYHVPADIFEIPKIIRSMRKDYTFYIRYNGDIGYIWPVDYVVLAL